MAWKSTGRPTVRQQRDKWVVRVDGIDTETGKDRPRQLGTYPSQRAARRALAELLERGDAESAVRADKGTVGEFVDAWAAAKVDVSPKGRQQYEWAAKHIRQGLGGIPLDRLTRDDVAGWIDGLAAGGVYSRRSIQIFRMVLRAALDEAVAEGRLRRSPAARVGMPRVVVKADRVREVPAWTEDDVRKFLAAVKDHRWYGPIRLDVLYGLRRSELLGLKWGDIDLKAGTVRVERGLTEVGGVPTWTDGKNARSRRTIPIDPTTAQHLGAHRRRQAEERLAAGSTWVDNDLLVASRTGTVVSPGNFDQTLERLVLRAGVPRLTSHGLRHTAATHMVRHASDIGEIRAAADLLGHSPDMLMRTYAHALPESVRTVTDKIAQRGADF